MRGLRPHELRRALGKQPPGPLYLCVGEEPYVAAQALDLLRAAAVGTDDLFNFDRFEAGDTPIDAIIAAAATLPVFAPRRLVVLTRAETLKTEEQEALAAALDAPAPTTCLVIVAAKADQRRRLFSSLLERAVVINCRPLLERELPAWLIAQAEALGLRLAPEVGHALIEQTGTSLHALINELEKLRAHAGTAPSTRTDAAAQRGAHTPLVMVGLERLAQLTAHGREHSVFELTDAAGERRLADALVLARRLLEQGEQPVGLVAVLTRHLRRLWLAKGAGGQRDTTAALAARLGVMPRYAESLARQAAGFDAPHLQWLLTRCVVADAQLKGGRLPKAQVIESLLIEVCRGLPGPLMVTPA
jgi:DNA polymerase-3 subunit delta